ncbi:S-adenosyl-L-methionine-dependent methyltransferases superfamily protein [Euphorbia peplus]|nr:S-adenosyl-L-methionine-dependent methyltransferases superfamily protein [Euphorbia peplus]
MEKKTKSNEMHQILHMKGGTGDQSYANNSKHQAATLSREASVLVQSVLDFCNTSLSQLNLITIAELGCSSGPTALLAVTHIINNIYKTCSESGRSSPPEISVLLNDLPGNDFNTLFKYLSDFHDKIERDHGPDLPPCSVAAVPGSFHERLFPSSSVHFVHSSFSLHWLSKVPPELRSRGNDDGVVNKGKIYISKTSSGEVIEAYQAQFRRNFSSFLKARAEEVVVGGRMVLLFAGRLVEDPAPDESCLLWDYLGQAFQALVNEGLIEEETLDTYNAPYYEASMEEVRGEIEKEGSFGIGHLGSSKITWDDISGGIPCDRATSTKNIAKSVRAGNESMFTNHFGPEIMDPLIQRFCNIMEADTKVVDHFSLVLSLIRKP